MLNFKKYDVEEKWRKVGSVISEVSLDTETNKQTSAESLIDSVDGSCN